MEEQYEVLPSGAENCRNRIDMRDRFGVEQNNLDKNSQFLAIVMVIQSNSISKDSTQVETFKTPFVSERI